MIYSLSGKVIDVKNDFLVLEVFGVGYKIFVGALSLELKINQELFLYTYQVVRENSLELFGFKKQSELQLFELLISISGIGPKVAMSIMSTATPSSLKHAVISENTDELTKISGIGKKNAQKIIIELANKIERIEISDDNNQEFDLEIYETLESLGFNRSQIRGSLSQITAKKTDEKIKEALKILGNTK